MIPLYAVQSSNVRAVGHDPKTNTLAVQFHDGGTYHYAGVPADLHQQLVNAPSVGSFLAKHIRARFSGQKK